MASLLEIKKRIGGVKNTRKITKAMQLVAASKMQYFQKRASSMFNYMNGLVDFLEINLQHKGSSLYTTENPTSNKVLFILYTSDKGLCGALNNKLLSTFENSSEWNNLAPENRLLITIGKKSNEFARRENIPVLEHLTGFSEKLNNLESLNLVDKILQVWKDRKVKQVIFVNPHFKNSFTYYPVLKQFLPLTQEMIDSQRVEDDAVEAKIAPNPEDKVLFEPSKEILTERLHEMLVHGLFMQTFLELKAAEYSSRMIAMKNATDAADKISDELTLSYNKARQQAITQEIAELVGATAAIQN